MPPNKTPQPQEKYAQKVEPQEGAEDDFDPVKVQARQREIAVKVCQDLCIFIVFLLSFTITVVLAHSADSASLVQKVEYFVEGSQFRAPLEKVESQESFYDYLQYSLIETLSFNETGRNIALAENPKIVPLDTSNILFGGVQIRQLRSEGESGCIKGSMFANYDTMCYPEFSLRTESQTTYGSGSQQFAYEASEVESSFAGEVSSYPNGGFYLPISNNGTELFDSVQILGRNGGYIDRGTRAIFVDFNVYNTNLNQFVATRVLVEFSASSSVYVTRKNAVLTPRLLQFFAGSTFADTVANFLDVVVVIFVLYYIAEELSEISLSRWEYFSDGWNVLDWINMALLLISFTMRMTAYMQVGDLKQPFGAPELSEDDVLRKTSYTDLQGIAGKTEVARLLNAFNAVLLWAKCIKYIGVFPYIQFLFHTIKRAMPAFWSFAAMFFVAFFGFVVCFIVLFGDLIRALSTFDNAWFFLARSFVADIDVLPIFDQSPIVGGVLVLSFYIVMIVVGVNIFFSIMAATLVDETYNPAPPDTGPEEEAITVMFDLIMKKAQNFFKFEKRLKANFPSLHKRVYGQKKKDEKDASFSGAITDGKDGSSRGNGKRAKGKKEDAVTSPSQSESAEVTGNKKDKTLRDFPPKEMLTAIENMAGRVLSKMHEVGIEIRIEMLRVQESLNQMVTVTNTLMTRIDRIQTSQKNLLDELLEG